MTSMTQDQVMEKLQVVFDDIFVDKVVVEPSTTAYDVPEWDSLTHVSLVLAVERAFSIRFRVGEVEATRSIGDLATLIAKKATN